MKSDLSLQADILEELKWEPSVNAAHIGVSVKDGVVTLTGHVPSYVEKFAAERVAKRVYGVKAIADELDVRLPGTSVRTDEDIAQSCVAALRYNASVPDERLKLLVRNGWVTLEGEVEWQFQKDAAATAVREQTGVTGLTNAIMLKPKVSPQDVRHQIEAAFQRNAGIDARRITVESHDGKVVLHGSVRSWLEREEAQQAAWAAPGVTDVENQITVAP
ncbi:MAG: BON domain-containing protein [Aureliella sp.]